MIMSQKSKVKGNFTKIGINNNVIGEGAIKAERVLNAWHRYCMQSRLFRLLRFFGLRN